MTASRRCGCGAELEEAERRLRCPGCGAEAKAWLVELDGETVAAGDGTEIYISPSWARERLGITSAQVRVTRPPERSGG